MSADSTDEYIQIGETTAIWMLNFFIRHIIEIYGSKYLCKPNPEELKTIILEYKDHVFPGCVGSIDGMHWAWQNCPSGWAGQFMGKEKKPTIVLEAVASHSLQIWHAFFGTAGVVFLNVEN